MKNLFLSLAFLLTGTFAFASTGEINKTNNPCDFVFVYVSSCGTENYQCGEFGVAYPIIDLKLQWVIFDLEDCGNSETSDEESKDIGG